MGLRPTNVRYVVLFALCLAAGLAYIHRGCLSVVESTARADLGLSPRDMGWAIGSFFWAYALFQIPTGLLVDRWGPRRSLTLFGLLGAVTVAMSAGTLGVDAATGFAILLVARVLMGIAQAGLFPASTRALSVWIPLRRRAFAAGTLQACMSLGGAVGAFITAQLLGIVYWPWVFVIYAVPGLAWSAWFFAWYRDRPDDHRGTNSAERALLQPEPTAAGSSPGSASLAVLLTFPVICLCAQQVFRAGANVFWFTWCPTYLQNAHGLSPRAAGSLTSLPIIGVVVGCIVGGWIADRVLVHTGSRRLSRAGTAVTACGLGALLFGLTFLIPEGQAALGVAVLSLAAIVVSCSNCCGYSAAMDLGGRNLATVFGAMNMYGNFGAALFSQLVPEWVGWFGWPAVVLLVGGSYACGLICWLPLNPDPKPRPPDAEE
ncbi:MAG TPA: MFS transporter [Gemmataceae bacterium]|nr:MFS transporter [Gemmataceae bacterium]